jgi:type I restriction enzyme R subunit
MMMCSGYLLYREWFEAHRTQYGDLSLNMRNALPKASYIGFTGTPLFSSDEITRRVFGNYVSRYGFQRAVEDGATVPLYYDARGEKLGVAVSDLNERIAAKLEELQQNGELEDINVTERLEKELKRDYHVITAKPRLDRIATDFVDHYSKEWESGKAMFVAIDKITAVRMHRFIERAWKKKIEELRKAILQQSDEQEIANARRRIAWMEETKIAVVISEEQGEVKKFRHWKIDIQPYRKLLKTGFSDVDGKSLSVEDAFKKESHPFRVAIVCAMWLTGFDVPCLGTLYLDKPLQAHTLMQAIARANRVHDGKNNGLIIDYCGILKNLRKALATFAGSTGGDDDGEVNPVKPSEELLPALASAIGLVYDFLREKGAPLEAVINSAGFERNAAIDRAKDAINENDETRKRFEIMAREVFSKFKACITLPGINDYRASEGAISIIYKSLQEDRDAADISHIIQQLHSVIEPAIVVRPDSKADGRLYHISAIDFDLLRREFERHAPNKQTVVHNLKDAIEKRLAQMLAQNPLRTNFQKRYEEIVAEYNGEKDRVTIEATFAALMRFVRDLDEESENTIREGLNEETKALFDLLKKNDLEKKDIDRIKKVAVELHAILLRKKAEIDEWRAKEQTRDEMRATIYDFLYSDGTGLPESYTDQEIVEKTGAIYGWAYRAYA